MLAAQVEHGLTRLPVELLQDIFESAAREHIHTRSLWTANLSLVCKRVREWVLPIVYRVFFVEHWVEAGRDGRPRHLHPSRAYFKYLLNTCKAVARQHIRHLVIMGVAFDGLIGDTGKDAGVARTDWELDSLTLPAEKVDFALQARIKPRRTCATDEYRPLPNLEPLQKCLEMIMFERAEHCRWTPALATAPGGGSACRVVALRSQVHLGAPRYFHLQLSAKPDADITEACAVAREALNSHPGVRVVFIVPQDEDEHDDAEKVIASLRKTFQDSLHAPRVRLSRMVWREDAYHSAAENVRLLRVGHDPWDIGVTL